MITLASLEQPRRRARIITVASDPGLGKTTLGAAFPDPVFIRTEEGSSAIEEKGTVALFPLSATIASVFESLECLLTEKHPFKTLVLDSITQLNTIIIAEILAAETKPVKSIAQACGGYGAGQDAVSNVHRKIREKCSELNEKLNMHILFLAHATTEQLDLPDQQPYSRYTIPLHAKSIPHYVHNVDAVGFIKQRTFTRGDEGDEVKKAVTDPSGSRFLLAYPTPSHISKNRFGITQDIPFKKDENPLAQYL